jgi:hypothetical protein
MTAFSGNRSIGRRDLPAVLRVIAGPERPAAGQPGRRRHLAGDGGRILLAGVAGDPGQELGPFPRRAPAPFLAREHATVLGSGAARGGKHLAFLVRQVIGHDRRQAPGGCHQLTAAAQRGVHARQRGGICRCSSTMASTAARSPGWESCARNTGHRSSSSAAWWLSSRPGRRPSRPAPPAARPPSRRAARPPPAAGTGRGAAPPAGRAVGGAHPGQDARPAGHHPPAAHRRRADVDRRAVGPAVAGADAPAGAPVHRVRPRHVCPYAGSVLTHLARRSRQCLRSCPTGYRWATAASPRASPATPPAARRAADRSAQRCN